MLPLLQLQRPVLLRAWDRSAPFSTAIEAADVAALRQASGPNHESMRHASPLAKIMSHALAA